MISFEHLNNLEEDVAS